MSDRDDYFIQPLDAIRTVSRTKGPRTLLTPEEIQIGRARVDAGESKENVALDLAMDEALMLLDMENGE